ncbi:MAG: stage IV sporulation protein A [Clostridiales bacterium]|nr:stage IV sporulation protein A [Clostridiales bacterium]
MDIGTKKEFDLYKDLQNRTGGEFYLGVVGPVRTGKSTFIKRFMDLMVLPFMEDAHSRERTVDELPQSAQGKTIMTTEPKFIPKDAAEIIIEDSTKLRVRLIDCVGFMIEGAAGHMEDGQKRMVKTPWFDYEIPFVEAASIGTEKVIKDHATIGIVITTDGSIGEFSREDYIDAEEKTLQELDAIGKPYVIVLNSQKPYVEETERLARQMREKYGTSVIPVNCEQLRKEDVYRIFEQMLYEFPVARVEFFIPKWAEMLPMEHPMKAEVIRTASDILDGMRKMGDIYGQQFATEQYVSRIKLEELALSTGCIKIRMEIAEKYYYENMSELAGIPIQGEYELISMIKEMAQRKEAYEKAADAFESVKVKGYGVVGPGLSDIRMEEPVLIKHGNKYGVKMRAVSPSIHMIKANIETEIAPIVGSEEQANDLIAYIKEGQQSEEGAWETNIFGKSIGELMEDGIRSKIAMMDDECQMKLQDTMQKIVNDSSGGMVCIII